ncbi:dynamin-1 [Caerostris extrusa]|uniref:Dynamin-1 n=1 Tax=Caerostris extrusa TaxID=172846 RepID=A0AAV4Q2M0_CAEEX|nr:dynamin-1 [Caerostris extrusa]
MDEGTNARDILENRQVTLKRGWVGVLNRSQLDIENGRDVQYILDKEKNFFLSKPYYRHLSEKMGTPFLRRMLQRTLRSHIKAALPQVRTRLAEKLAGYKKKLKEFEKNVGEESGGRQYYMVKLVNNFIKDIELKLMGQSELIDMKQLSAGAYINYKLNTEVQSNLRLDLVPDDEEMTILITNLNGLRGSISFPSLALDCVNRKLVAQFEYPLEKCVDCIHEILQEAVSESAALLNRYPATKAEVLFRIDRSMKKEAEVTLQKLREHVQAEMFYVNLEHPDMDLSVCDPVVPAVGPSKIWQTCPAAPEPQQPTASTDTTTAAAESTSENGEAIAVQSTSSYSEAGSLQRNSTQLVDTLMRNLSMQQKVQYLKLVTTKYIEIVQKQISDLTVKYIVCFLVKKVLDYIREDLVLTLLASSNFESLTEDCDEDFRIKEEMEAACLCINDALEAIQAF